ncbi:protein of unknown function [Petrocella atlantisensis]|uniref:Uncharacterized protein n=1 Tax=Petrocella atlantisensis TaxID=2173034 RepID=A0A3P7PEG3_9FIRM|nr:protein of unknown function [Petrocella atlantisensis]
MNKIIDVIDYVRGGTRDEKDKYENEAVQHFNIISGYKYCPSWIDLFNRSEKR